MKTVTWRLPILFIWLSFLFNPGILFFGKDFSKLESFRDWDNSWKQIRTEKLFTTLIRCCRHFYVQERTLRSLCRLDWFQFCKWLTGILISRSEKLLLLVIYNRFLSMITDLPEGIQLLPCFIANWKTFHVFHFFLASYSPLYHVDLLSHSFLNPCSFS